MHPAIPSHFPPHVVEHIEACAECQQSNLTPLCASGSRLLVDWLLRRLDDKMREAAAAVDAAEASHLHFLA